MDVSRAVWGCFGKLYISIGDLKVPPDRCPQLLFLSPKKNLEFSSIAAATVMFLRGVSLKMHVSILNALRSPAGKTWMKLCFSKLFAQRNFLF